MVVIQRRTGVCCVAVLLACGCQRGAPDRPEALSDSLGKYAALPLAMTSHSAPLRDELARLAAEKATPADLQAEVTKDITTIGAAASGAPFVRELKILFPAEVREGLNRTLQAAFPDGMLQAEPILRHEVAKLLEQHEDRRRSYQRILLRGDRPRVHEHARAMAADLTYLELVATGNRLESAYISQLLGAGRLQAAREPLVVMSQAIEWLARERHLAPRLAAADRRKEWLRAVEAVANHPQVDHATRDWLLEFLEGVLGRWPSDAEAWIGERGCGLLTYELVRDGYLLSLLAYDEVRVYREEIGVKELGKLVGNNLDVDELFYLTTMRHIIDACAQPYYQRHGLSQDLEAELECVRNSAIYPFVADHLLLVDVAEQLRQQALDRARCEAWRLALLLASGRAAPAGQVNPLTGEAFPVRSGRDEIVVGPVDPLDEDSLVRIGY